jgi:hypothetical protein
MFKDKTIDVLPVMHRYEVSYLKVLGAKEQRKRHWC